MKNKKVMLIIRDGWGFRQDCHLNAICEGATPYTDNLMSTWPNTILATSGKSVGLPAGYQGNSEVGHMTIGGGRIMFQSLERINKSIKTGDFFENKAFKDAIANCKQNNSTLHLAGLLQTEGVHSHQDHLFALLELCKKENFCDIVIHVITDGRDAPVNDSIKHLKTLYKKIKELSVGRIATVSGRYYAMDRGKHWDWTQKAYECIANVNCERRFEDAVQFVQTCHQNDETDEFIKPTAADFYQGISDHDSFIFFNFRTDRPRQLTRAIIDRDFSHFPVRKLDIFYVTMTNYYAQQSAKIAFPDQAVNNFLGETLSKLGLKQLRISETEKYAHVTFFFNGQIEAPFEGEERIIVPSVKVETYDLKPEMSVYEIAEELVTKIDKQDYSLVVTNLVNGDMVGHTGITEAIRKAVNSVDQALQKIVKKGLEKGYDIIIFADHGNAEDQTEKWRTSHTINPVPCILVSNDTNLKNIKLKQGKGLQDIAPTVLKLLEISKPKEMTGESLI